MQNNVETTPIKHKNLAALTVMAQMLLAAADNKTPTMYEEWLRSNKDRFNFLSTTPPSQQEKILNEAVADYSKYYNDWWGKDTQPETRRILLGAAQFVCAAFLLLEKQPLDKDPFENIGRLISRPKLALTQ